MKAIVLGATGATGKELVLNLLNDDYFDKVIIFVRKNIFEKNDRLEVHQIDFDKINEYKDLIKADICFSCLGTTLKVAGSKSNQWRVDYNYQYNFAKHAKENAVKTFVLVSSHGANPKSSFFYYKMKGALEEAIKILHFERTIFFRPGPLDRGKAIRSNEIFLIKLIKILNKIGLARSQKPLPTSLLAKAMIKAVKAENSSFQTFNTREIFELLV